LIIILIITKGFYLFHDQPEKRRTRTERDADIQQKHAQIVDVDIVKKQFFLAQKKKIHLLCRNIAVVIAVADDNEDKDDC
jgi:hypothetical protein